MSTEASSVVEAVEIPAAMMAWQVPTLGEPADVMALETVPVPSPGPGQVLVDVWSSGLNFPDALLTRGLYQERPDLPFTPGMEFCGEIVGVGEGVPRARLGERVMGTPRLPFGSLAEFALADADAVVPAPAGLDDTHAAVFHVAYQTGWFGLYRRAGLRVGETVLVHAAAGGVGSAAVQLARAQGAHVIGVVGSPDKVPVARKLGAGVVVDRSQEDVVATVLDATGGRGVDVVYDPVGGEAFRVSTKVVAFEGRIVVVGFAGGEVPHAAANHVLVKNYGVLGVHAGLYAKRKPELVRRANDELSALVQAGALYPLVSEKLQFDDAPDGIARIAEGRTTGRIAVAQP